MLYDYYNAEFFDMLDSYINRAFEIMTQKSVVLLIIQGVLLAFSIWDKNSRFFVILATIGVYSVHGNISIWISIYRRELAARKLDESRRKQYNISIDIRRSNQFCWEIFIPVKELAASEMPNKKFYFKNNYLELYA